MISATCRGVLVAASLMFAPLAAQAQTFDISYTGTDAQGFTTGTTTGSGSFTLTGGVLTAFTLSVTETASGQGGSDTFSWGLSVPLDNTFSYTLVDGDITALSFVTDVQAGNNTPDQFFNLFDLNPGDALTINPYDIGVVTSGTLTVQPDMGVPEPASALVLGVGLAGLVAARRRVAGRKA